MEHTKRKGWDVIVNEKERVSRQYRALKSVEESLPSKKIMYEEKKKDLERMEAELKKISEELKKIEGEIKRLDNEYVNTKKR